MADYATLLRDHVTLTCRSVDRIFLQAYVPKLQSVGWVGQFLRWQRGYEIRPRRRSGGSVTPTWPRCTAGPSRGAGVPVRQGGEQGGDRPPADRGCRTGGRRREGGADWDCPGEDLGVAVLEGQGPGARPASAHGVGPADGLRQPLLLLPMGPRVGRSVLEDHRLRPWPV